MCDCYINAVVIRRWFYANQIRRAALFTMGVCCKCQFRKVTCSLLAVAVGMLCRSNILTTDLLTYTCTCPVMGWLNHTFNVHIFVKLLQRVLELIHRRSIHDLLWGDRFHSFTTC